MFLTKEVRRVVQGALLAVQLACSFGAMMLGLGRFFVPTAVGLVVLVACGSGAGVAEVSVTGPATLPNASAATTAQVVASTTAPPSTAEPATSVPDTTATTVTTTAPAETSTSLVSADVPSGDVPIFAVVDRLVLGRWDGTSWIAPDREGIRVPPIRGHQLRSVNDDDLVVITQDPTTGCFPEDGVATWYISDLIPGLAVSGHHRLQPRPLADIAPAPEHFAAVREVLARDGVTAEVEIDRVIRFDLEGDGVDEVIIEANRLESDRLWGLGPGNYSILLLQRLGPNGTVENSVIYADTEPPPADHADSLTVVTVEALADVNGDGTFELATHYYGYEWGGYSLWDLTGAPSRVLGSGCGV